MTTRLHHRILLGVALLAIMGTFPVEAQAKSCCATMAAADCRCCGATEATGSRSETIRFQSGDGTMVSNAPGLACDCRSSDTPDAPSPRPASNSSEQSRTDRGHHEVIAHLDRAPRPIPTGWRLVSGNESLTNVPRYLRTLHLLV